MKYEYSLMYFRVSSGACIGRSAETFVTLDAAMNRARELNARYNQIGEEVRVARREVGEWEVGE